jgi:hypothetical protein
MTQVKLTRVWTGTQETQYGIRDKMSIKCEQLGEEWLSTLKMTPSMKQWKEGDTVEINVTKKKSKDGQKTFYNFEEGLSLGAGLSPMPSQPKEQIIQIEEEEDIFKF